MGAKLRVFRERINAVGSIQKITKAMEMIAASRIVKAQAAAQASRPYAEEMTRVLTALASSSTLDHPLLVERENPRRAAVLVVTSDRGLAGGYSVNTIRRAEELMALLREEGKEPKLYVIGRKGVGYYRFRNREIVDSWTGFTEQPAYENAREAGHVLLNAFTAGADDTAEGPGADELEGVDELHIVYTEFVSMALQRPVAKRIAPLEVEEAEEPPPAGYLPEYEFEPDPESLLSALLPQYITSRLYAALLEASASESAARQRAMKAASDNADELITTLTRQRNQARQAEITQEIAEIVGGAESLAS